MEGLAKVGDGLVAEVGKSSVTGTDAGSPYTCHARCARIGAEVGCGQWVATAAWRGTHRGRRREDDVLAVVLGHHVEQVDRARDVVLVVHERLGD